VLDGCRAEDLKLCAEQVRTAVSGTQIRSTGHALDVSVSIGAITFEGWSGHASVEQLLKLADEALYQAKASGRNCVSLWGDALSSDGLLSRLDSVN
jgi:diguanylate cyclase